MVYKSKTDTKRFLGLPTAPAEITQWATAAFQTSRKAREDMALGVSKWDS
jgi:hypothetical protein